MLSTCYLHRSSRGAWPCFERDQILRSDFSDFRSDREIETQVVTSENEKPGSPTPSVYLRLPGTANENAAAFAGF